MSLTYTELHEKTVEIKERLSACVEMLEKIKPEERRKYKNPQYRIWSEEIKDLEGFTSRLEEWLSQPPVAEAKRYLSNLKKWSESPERTLEEVEKDWKFLSDNVEKIKDVLTQIGGIGYENIKKKTSTWALNRIIEKDMEKAKNWATNANKFTNSLKQLENRKVESTLAEEVKNGGVKELLKVTSYDKDNKEAVNRYHELIDKAENMVKNKPEEINEKAVLETYSTNEKDMKIEKNLSTISEGIEKIKGFLIDLEWVGEFSDFEDYNTIWKEKQNAIKKNDLESISKALQNTLNKANDWKESKKKGINNALLRAERMAKNVGKEDLEKEFTSLRRKVHLIDWDKPDLGSLHKRVSKIDNLRKQLREELIRKLRNEDAPSMIEEPEIIEDLGQKKGWNFDRFFKALEVVLRSGLIEIRMVEEK